MRTARETREYLREVVGFDDYQQAGHGFSWLRAIVALLTAAVVLGIVALAHAADAQSSPQGLRCGSVKDITDGLAEKYHEMPQVRGVTRAGNLMVLFASGDGTTWSLVGMNTRGVACLLDAGQQLQIEPQGTPS